ncbi:cystatin-A-like [Anneissia japonica]|uniref:cystatin-A-like n=1 Tax=Anneissia japonica TaxID=1529436 RepID=UPI001425669E|nr:cystatin-A-like [Anneissia japonica]
MSSYGNRTVPGGWSQPSQAATESVQRMVTQVKNEFEELAQAKYSTFQATKFWDQNSRKKGMTNYCVKIDVGDSKYIYVELSSGRICDIELKSLLREWAWEDGPLNVIPE